MSARLRITFFVFDVSEMLGTPVILTAFAIFLEGLRKSHTDLANSKTDTEWIQSNELLTCRK